MFNLQVSYSDRSEVEELRLRGLVPFIVGLVLIFGITSSTFGQKSKISEVKNSQDYYWGEFCAENIQVASDNALQQLISKIAVRVQTDFKSIWKEEEADGDIDVEEKTENVVKTYSTATLKNVETIKYPSEECGINVFNYIKKDQVDAIFEGRKELVQDLFLRAREYEGEQNYSSALKLYNFALVLINSIPEQSIEFGTYNLTTFIPEQINSIIQNIDFEVIRDEMVDDKTREIALSISVDDKPANRIDFSYWNGNTQVHSKGKDGEAVIQLYGSSTQLENLKLKIKYNYYQQRNEIKEVGQLWNLVVKPKFSNRMTISLDEQKEDKPDKKEMVAGKKEEDQQTNIAEVEGVEEYPNNIDPQTEMLESFVQENELPEEWKQDEFLSDKASRVNEHNNLSMLDTDDSLSINKTYEGWEARKIPVLGNYETLHIQSKEYLVPDFDEDGQLVDVNFGVMDGFYDKFQYQSQFGNDWKERKVIIKFMEKYRTAFLSRDVDQLKTMFADKAVIIVGRVLKEEGASDQYKYEQGRNQPEVEYLKYSKNEYIERQERLFEEKEDILLEFSTFDIHKKNNQPGIYGISLRQQYYSTNYSDEGYLFLLVDFNEDKPKIYVRAWQPQEWNEESLIGLGNFNINF